MWKILLTCAIVGVGSTFDVEVDDGAKVGELKEPIEQENPNTLKDVDAPNLQLFLAKKTDGKWLNNFQPDDDQVHVLVVVP
ncbi:hypothetical protein PHYSODRAFT_413021, partial [Phytophthora sojae]